MSKLAYINPHDNNRVLQWLDTEAFDFQLPDAALLHSCSDEDWERQHLEAPQMVQGGRVVDYAPVAPTHEALAAAAWAEIKIERDRRKAGGVKVGTKWYHSDETSRTQYIGLLHMADAAVAAGGTGSTTLQYGGQDIQWKTMDGTFIKMTVQRAKDVFNAVSGLDFAAFGAAEAHKAAMEASADPASYDFSAGWPATFAR